MKIFDKSINVWQASILMFILLFANKIIVLPSLLYEGAGLESIFALIFMFCLEMGLLLLFYFLKNKYPTQSLSSILQACFGKIVKTTFFIGFMIFFLSKAVLLYNVTYIFFRNLIYKDTTNLLILFCFLPVINHLVISGLRVIGRTAQLFFPVIFGTVIFCLVVGLFGINSRTIIFSHSFVEVIMTGLKHISPFGDMMFIFIIMDKIEIKKGQWKIFFSLSAVASFMIIAITLIFMLSYSYTSFMHPYAIFEIVSFVKEFGGIGRIDIITMVLIILFSYLQLALFFKVFAISFHEVFKNCDWIYGILTFDIAFTTIVVFFIVNLESAVVFGEQILTFAIILPFIVFPLFILIAIFRSNKKMVNTKVKGMKSGERSADTNQKELNNQDTDVNMAKLETREAEK